MSKVKLGLSGLNALEAIAKARHLVAMQTGNPAYSTPVPALATITSSANALQTAYDQAVNRDSVKVANRNTAQEILEDLLRQNAAYVQMESDSDGDTILSSGWELIAGKSPVGLLPPTESLKVSNIPGYPGKLKLDWKKVKGCNTFIIHRSMNPSLPAEWTPVAVVTKTSYLDEEVTPGAMYYYTVTSVGPLGEGGVSEISNGRAL